MMRQMMLFHKSNSGDDLVVVLSRYAEVDSGQMDLRLTRMEAAGTREGLPVLSATFPIRQFTAKRNEECF